MVPFDRRPQRWFTWAHRVAALGGGRRGARPSRDGRSAASVAVFRIVRAGHETPTIPAAGGPSRCDDPCGWSHSSDCDGCGLIVCKRGSQKDLRALRVRSPRLRRSFRQGRLCGPQGRQDRHSLYESGKSAGAGLTNGQAAGSCGCVSGGGDSAPKPPMACALAAPCCAGTSPREAFREFLPKLEKGRISDVRKRPLQWRIGCDRPCRSHNPLSTAGHATATQQIDRSAG